MMVVLLKFLVCLDSLCCFSEIWLIVVFMFELSSLIISISISVLSIRMCLIIVVGIMNVYGSRIV